MLSKKILKKIFFEDINLDTTTRGRKFKNVKLLTGGTTARK